MDKSNKDIVHSLLVITPDSATPHVSVYGSKKQLSDALIERYAADLVDQDPAKIKRLEALSLDDLVKWAEVQGNFTILVDIHDVWI